MKYYEAFVCVVYMFSCQSYVFARLCIDCPYMCKFCFFGDNSSYKTTTNSVAMFTNHLQTRGQQARLFRISAVVTNRNQVFNWWSFTDDSSICRIPVNLTHYTFDGIVRSLLVPELVARLGHFLQTAFPLRQDGQCNFVESLPKYKMCPAT